MLPRLTLRHFTHAALLLILAAAPAGASGIVDSGLDIWVTHGNGATFLSFAEQPLPADFFCAGSAPFHGAVVFRGVPIATTPVKALGNADTILERLDDAVFDETGLAVTRLQMRALHFEGVQLLRNKCGAFKVEVMLDGEQPITEMRIQRESAHGGYFEAEVAVHAKLVFTPQDHKGEILEIPREVTFPARNNTMWADSPGQGAVERRSFVVVDTDADGTPDTFLQGTSENFAAGWPATPAQTEVFRRAHFMRNGPEVSGFLGNGNRPEAPALADPEALGSVDSVHGAADLCSAYCHCDPGCGNHCLTPVCELCAIP